MFPRILKYAIKNILRNIFLSVSSILVLSLLMFFINVLFVLYEVSFKLIDSINSKLTISLYLKDTYDKNSLEVVGLLGDIKNTLPNIKILYKTKDEVMKELQKKDAELVKILQSDGVNPLPSTISLSNIKLDQYESLDDLIEKRMFVFLEQNKNQKNQVSSYKDQYNNIMKVITTINTLQLGLYFIIAIFLISIFVIVYSIISNFIFYYRDEIYITKLVGGSNSFIYGPFSVQGVIYVIISFIFSMSLFLLLLNNINFLFSSFSYKDFIYNDTSLNVFTIEFLVFSFIGAISGFFSSKKYIY
ncbi:MAG: hypothetical protein PHR68_00885 [Candidatus Gracilibacteria bacterium]|nr:hypothetical protein [Candidatus Gracilibacteria bacterium]